MTIATDLNGTFSLAELDRLTFPVAWNGTVPAAEQEAQETALRDLVRDAKEQLQQAYDFGDGETELEIEIKDGVICGIVEV